MPNYTAIPSMILWLEVVGTVRSNRKPAILEKYLGSWGGIIINGLSQRASAPIHLVYIDCHASYRRYNGEIEDHATSRLQDSEIALVCADSTLLADHLVRHTQSGYKFSLFLLDPYGPTGIPFSFVSKIVQPQRHDTIIYVPYLDLVPNRDRIMYYLYLTTHDPSRALAMNKLLYCMGFFVQTYACLMEFGPNTRKHLAIDRDSMRFGQMTVCAIFDQFVIWRLPFHRWKPPSFAPGIKPDVFLAVRAWRPIAKGAGSTNHFSTAGTKSSRLS